MANIIAPSVDPTTLGIYDRFIPGSVRRKSVLPPISNHLRSELGPVMAAPPAVTSTTTALASSTLFPVDQAGLFRYGRTALAMKLTNGSGDFMVPKQPRTPNFAEPTASTAAPMSIEWASDQQTFQIPFWSVPNTYYQLFVDGVPATAGPVIAPGTLDTTLRLLNVVLATDPGKMVNFKLDIVRGWFGGVRQAITGMISQTSAPALPRVGILGDSYTVGTGTSTNVLAGMVPLVGRLLGWDILQNGCIGGTGYLNTNSNAQYKFGDRLQADVLAYQPEGLWLFDSLNDGGFETGNAIYTEKRAVITAARAGLPAGTPIFSSLVMYPASVSSLDGIYTQGKQAAIDAGIPYIDTRPGGLLWITGNGKVGGANGSGPADKARAADGLHPSDFGHNALGSRVAAAAIAIATAAMRLT